MPRTAVGPYSLKSCVYLALVRSQTKISANCFKSVTMCIFHMHCFGRRIKASDRPDVQILHLQTSGLFVTIRCCSGFWLLAGKRQVPVSAAEQNLSPHSYQKLLSWSSNPSSKALVSGFFESNSSPSLEGCNTSLTFKNSVLTNLTRKRLYQKEGFNLWQSVF